MPHQSRFPVLSTAVTCEGFDCPNDVDVSKSLCLSCDSTYCDICWERQGPHQPGKTGVDGLPHEKTDKNIYERLKAILDPPEDVAELSRLHQADEITTWFGIEKDQSGKPIFQDYGRYATLMADTRQPNASIRYPQLVSFVGQTGAGKSTLIKMLVSLNEQKLQFRSNSPFESPVVGSTKHDKSPTSGDVHLYADPETAYTRLPMLYADCEGLEGGEMLPVATKLRQTLRKADHGHGQTRHRIFKGQPRELVYARTNAEARNREWAVRKVYPRLLYTFSDVIVFVLRNPKTFKSSTLKLLLEWASTSLESSINQPTLPHAIIVLNTTSPAIDEDEWDIPTATKRLMDHVAHAVVNNDFFNSYARHWRRKGRKINTMVDLIRCYYADISVVRVPEKGRYMLTNLQIVKLHREIIKHCDASVSAKDDAHMLSNVDELNSYLQAGFDHFTTNEDSPFNFVDVAFKNKPIPRDFGDHMLELAVKVQEVTHVRDGPNLFKILSFMVASCIFTDCIRQSRPGKAVDLFDRFYANSCAAALEHFCDKYWRCSFVSKKGKACVNLKSSHSSKGHQCADGKIISSGYYISGDFSSFLFSRKWKAFIKYELRGIEREFEERRNAVLPVQRAPLTASDSCLAYSLHRTHMERFYRAYYGYTASNFISLTTCFSCLMEVPEHPLQCGHVLCTTCIKAHGHSNDRNSITMSMCPLHSSHTFRKPWILHFKPDYAGVRILALDGGGIRGIIELEVLRAIEEAIGGKIPIQAFFDLIIGTSTGGIVALGLGVKQWTVNQCVTEFSRLCDQAFSPREFNNVAGLEVATTLAHGSKYKTTPLHDALRSVFGQEELYGGRRKDHSVFNTQVAVTATSGTGEQGLILANYSRHEENEPNYKFEFPHNLQVWEAACATSAAPSFFKPFVSTKTFRTYLDGALYYNNPVRVANHERKFLWPDVAENPPDILLSIGTGKNGQRMEEELQVKLTGPSAIRQTKPKSGNRLKNWGDKLRRKAKQHSEKKKRFILVSKFFGILVNRIDNILNSELEWKQFCKDIFDGRHLEDDQSRYIRINLDLKQDPPKIDEKTKMSELQDLSTRLLKTDDYRNLIENIAHRLIASTFYFSKKRNSYDEFTGTWTCIGKIVCRFEGNSSELRRNMRELGDYLRHQQVSGYQPYFSVQNQLHDSATKTIPITERMIEDMIKRAEFLFEDPLEIHVTSQLSSTMIYLKMCGVQSDQANSYPISGFPRYLVTEDTVNATRLDKRAELIKERRYGSLIVANDPKIVLASNEGVKKTAKESEASRSNKPFNPPRADSLPATKEQDHSRHSRNPSSVSSAPPDDSADQKVAINVLRAQADNTFPQGKKVEVEDAEELSHQVASSLTLLGKGSDLPYPSDDSSDGPPSDEDKEEAFA